MNDTDLVDAVPGSALPGDADVRSLLDGLFVERVSVHAEPSPVLPGRGVHVVATYVDADGALRALVLLDLTLGCALGAALAVLPPSQVEAAAAEGAVPPELADATQEVLAVAAALFGSAESSLRLREVQVAPAPATDDVVDLLRAAPDRVDMTVEVPGYGTGVLVLLREQPER